MTHTVDGGRQYRHPVSGIMVPSVTTILDALDKPQLDNWAIEETAFYAVANLSRLAQLDPEDAITLLKGARWKSTRDGVDRGNYSHGILEDLARGVAVLRTPQNGWVLDCWEGLNQEFDIQILEAEATFWHPGIFDGPDGPELGYAGSGDVLGLVNGELSVLDWKSTASGIWGETALQCCGYGMAPKIIRPDGTELDVLKEYGQVMRTYGVWLRPDDSEAPKYQGPSGWSLLPLRYDDEVWRAFRAARIAWEWQNNWSKGAVGKALNTKPLRRTRIRKKASAA